MKPNLILVPTDFSEPAAHALRFAGRLAERFGATVRLLYADYFVPPVDFSASAAVEYALTSDEAADEAKKHLIRIAKEILPKGVAYETRVIVDSPVPAIVDEARNCNANLVIMGTHGRTGFRRLVVGSVTESVMRVVNVPVIAISPLTDERRIAASLSRVVCAVDDSEESREALRVCAALADAPLSKIVVVRCIDTETPQEAADEIVRLQEWTPADIVDRCTYKLLPADHPAEQIVELAKLLYADLIAAGCAAKGHTTERIVPRSNCPVLVVNDMAVLARSATAELATA